MKRVHNPGPYEVVYNRRGNILPGFTSVITDITDPITARLLRQGRLILPVEPTPEPVPEPEPAPKTTKTTKTSKSGE